MLTTELKEDAERLVQDLREDTPWNELMHKIDFRQAIEAGIEDSEAGRTMDVNEMSERFGLLLEVKS